MIDALDDHAREPAAAADAAQGAGSADDAPAEEMQAELDALRAEVESLRERHARAAADYQNLRRRAEEDRRVQARLLQAESVRSLLPVLDDLRRALELVDEEEDLREHSWVEGVRMVQRKFEQTLEAQGVIAIEAEGLPFDPTRHEAVGYGPGPAEHVIAELQRGYAIDDHVVRPARVLVGSGEGGEPASADANA